MRMNSRMVLAAVVAVVLAGGLGVVGIARSDEPAPSPAVDKAMLDKMVQEEVQKELPGLVQAEVKRQLATLVEEGSRNARMNAAASTMQTLRSQLELYKIQHADNFPTMAQMADWRALSSKTDMRGTVSPTGEFGPYLAGIPTNPITGKKGVAMAGRAPAEAGWSWDEKQGKLYLVLTEADLKAYPELKGKIELDVAAAGGAGAATAKPVATLESKVSSLAALQQTVRDLAELYKIQHQDQVPTFEAASGWKFLTEKSEAGPGSTNVVGPYIQKPPVNALNGSSKIARAGAATADSGWTYDEKSGKITAVVPEAMAKEVQNWSDYEVGK